MDAGGTVADGDVSIGTDDDDGLRCCGAAFGVERSDEQRNNDVCERDAVCFAVCDSGSQDSGFVLWSAPIQSLERVHNCDAFNFNA